MDGEGSDGGSRPRRRLPRALRAGLWMGAGALVALATVIAAALLSLPLLEERPDLVARWLSERVGRPVHVGEMSIAWRSGAPVVRLRNLEIGPRRPGADTLAVGSAEVRVDTLGSLRGRTLRPRAVTVQGAHLTLTRDARGQLTVAGLGLSGPAPADRAAGLALASLPPDAVVGIENSRLTLVGFHGDRPASGEDIVLEPVDLRLRSAGTGLQLSGAVAAAGAQPPVRFTLRWPDGAAGPLVGADLTLSTRGFPLASVNPQLLPVHLSGTLDLDLDGRLAEGRLSTLRGTFSVERPRLQDGGHELALDAAHGLVDFSAQRDGWQLTVLRLQARHAGRLQPPSRVTVNHGRDDASYEVRMDHAPLAALRAMLPFTGAPADLGGWINQQGQVEDLHLTLTAAGDALEPRLLRATLRDVMVGGEGRPVTVGPADVGITVQGRAGKLTLHDAAVRLTGHRSGSAVEVAADGIVRWHVSPAGLVQFDSRDLRVSDGDARVHLGGAVEVPGGDAGQIHLDLTGVGENVDAQTFRRHLALGLLPDALGEWLERAILAGHAPAASARVEGTLSQLARLEGVMKVQATLEGVDLGYQPGWPALENLSGTIELDGPDFRFEVADGSVAGARIVGARGHVSGLSGAEVAVEISGTARGLTQNGASFISATPLAPRFAGLLQQLDARGSAALELDLHIPLTSAPSRVRGALTLKENTLRIPALRSALESVHGRIDFDGGGLREGALEATYLDRTIRARVDGSAGERTITALTISGATDRAGLVRHLYDVGALDSQAPAALPLLSRLSGEAGWQVTLEIPYRNPLEGQGIGLAITSDLKGMALALPAPLGKTAGQRRALSVRTRLTQESPRLFHVRYGQSASALLEMARDDSGFALRRGALRFGGEATLVAAPGMRVDGTVELLSVDDWVELVAEVAGPGAQGNTPGVPLGRVSNVDIAAQRLVALGAGFDQVRLTAEHRSGNDWRVQVNGEAIRGEISIPDQLRGGVIDARFDHLHVRRGSAVANVGSERASNLDPRLLPEVRLSAEALRYEDLDLGLSKLTLRHVEDGLQVSELFALNDAFELRGSGSWTGQGASARSRLELRIHSADFGHLTQVLGYGDSGVEGGVSDIALSARWNGSPFDFALDRVQGELHFRAAEGILREVDQGATGRVFGLLNLTVLPQRLLRLDFNDLFQEGVSYDLIEGSFLLTEGDAYTDNTSMHTQTARVDLSGRVGLVAQDYDQVMTVTPKLSESLPLAPLWLAEKFLNRKLIDPAFAYRYIITGTWDDPKVEKVRVKAVPSEAG